ncbi:hypothetical protein IV500_17755 [Paeniglutamicibacter antarcticus]|uniref:Uncharacterized protein n=1 Tax=Arthrobacter terrae TaxID=2935737 RepID=A0A931CRQ9_9MICC|nr:hypothetical protein [Arthrobacter terrae]MBG0741215.1 hypothetical protein [Arthrobacter terrae]
MSLLELVAKGMRVVDASGKMIGKVDHVKGPNPKAAAFEEVYSTAAQNVLFVGLNSMVGTEPRVPEEMARRLFRTGYVKIDGKGFLARNSYAAADELERIEDGKLYLCLSQHELPLQE